MAINILIVEDNEITRKMFRIALTAEGYNVLEAETAEAALLITQQNKLDLILQDLMLPDMDGFELNRHLRELPNATEIPIIALSGFLNKLEDLQSIGKGFSAFLIKPVDPSNLVAVIQSYFPAMSAEERVGKGERILIADDDQVQLKLLALNLQQAGFVVSTATDGRDALEKIINNPPAAVVSDILMPNLDGFELCLEIRQHPKFAKIPVILQTLHYIEPSDYALAQEVGANDYISKTPDSKSIIEALVKHLKTKLEIIPTVSTHLFREQHIHRLVRQLERQVALNAVLSQRNALQMAQLTLLRGVANALTSQHGIDETLQEVLTSCLDAAGISKGLLYLRDAHTDSLVLRQMIGYDLAEKEKFTDFFGLPEILTESMDKRAVIAVPSNVLQYTSVTSGLIVPLIFVKDCLGVLFLGSYGTNVLAADTTFASTLGTHIAQLLSLADTFERLTISEQRNRTLMDNASCGIMTFDANDIIVDANKQMELFFDCSKDQIIGRDYRDFIFSPERDLVDQQIKQKTKLIECHVRQENGTLREVEISVSAVQMGKENLFLAIVNDVTERNHLRSSFTVNLPS